MDLQNMDLKGGSLQISTEVIGKIARCAALEVDGVSEGSCGKQNISRKFLHDFIGNAVNERTVGTEPVKHFSGLAGQTKLD